MANTACPPPVFLPGATPGRGPGAWSGPERAGGGLRRLGALLLAAGLGAAALPAEAIQGGMATSGFASVGTGVQVTADWVFTAHHVALNPGDTFTNGYGSRVVAARYDAPGSGSFPANDFSLVRLVAAPTLAPQLAVEASVPADGPLGPVAATITSASADGLSRSFAQSAVDAFTVQIDPDDGGPLGAVTANYLLSLDASVYVQGGDSGRGLFVGHVADSGVLWGINSAQLQDAGGQPAGSAFVLPAAYRGWIDQVMVDDATDAQAVLWVSSVPEPGTWALAGLGLLGLGAVLGRRRGG